MILENPNGCILDRRLRISRVARFKLGHWDIHQLVAEVLIIDDDQFPSNDFEEVLGCCFVLAHTLRDCLTHSPVEKTSFIKHNRHFFADRSLLKKVKPHSWRQVENAWRKSLSFCAAGWLLSAVGFCALLCCRTHGRSVV